jgi:hypothetical protein
MLTFAFDDSGLVARCVTQFIPHMVRGFGANRALGVYSGGEMIAGIVFHNYAPTAGVIEISVAALPGRRWLMPQTIRAMYGFAFEGCHCQMVLHLVPADDRRLLRMLAAGGYTLIKVPRLLGRERDGVICTLTEEAWRNNKIVRRYKLAAPQIDMSRMGEAA